MDNIKIDASKIPKADIEFLARGVLNEIGDFFNDPKNQEDYARWLASRSKESVVA